MTPSDSPAVVPPSGAPSGAPRAPSPEECTAALLYRLAESLAFSDEPGSTAQAWEVACRANALARLEIERRTRGYEQLKANIDDTLAQVTTKIADLRRVLSLVRTSADVVHMVDDLLLLAAAPL